MVTFAILKTQDTEASEGIGNDSEIGVGDARVEGSRDGLREIELMEASEAGGHLAEHVGSGAGAELAALCALQMEPPLAHQPEHLLVLVALQLSQYYSQLVVPKGLVYR